MAVAVRRWWLFKGIAIYAFLRLAIMCYFLLIVLLGVLFIVVLCCSVTFILVTGLKQRTEIVAQKVRAGCSNVG